MTSRKKKVLKCISFWGHHHIHLAHLLSLGSCNRGFHAHDQDPHQLSFTALLLFSASRLPPKFRNCIIPYAGGNGRRAVYSLPACPTDFQLVSFCNNMTQFFKKTLSHSLPPSFPPLSHFYWFCFFGEYWPIRIYAHVYMTHTYTHTEEGVEIDNDWVSWRYHPFIEKLIDIQ